METSGDELQIPEGWESILHVEHDGTIDAKYEISSFIKIVCCDLYYYYYHYFKLLFVGLWSLLFYLLINK